MSKLKPYSIYYIAGNGHSGSTLLDIILGSPEGYFSGGELNFITRNSILEEYCSCNTPIKNCKVWAQIFEKWETKRKVSLAEVGKLRWKFERNKKSLTTLFSSFFPSKDFLNYCQCVESLFDSIHEVTNAKVIIDSSKSPQRIAILKRFGNVTFFHLCRSFKGVLNSAKHASLKDIKNGIEADNPARRTIVSLADWVFTNFVTQIFLFGTKGKKILYAKYTKDLKTLQEFDFNYQHLSNNTLFHADHMLAGNVLRLKKNIKIDPKLGANYKRLNSKQRFLATVIDVFFWFWH